MPGEMQLNAWAHLHLSYPWKGPSLPCSHEGTGPVNTAGGPPSEGPFTPNPFDPCPLEPNPFGPCPFGPNPLGPWSFGPNPFGP